ncbi:MAG: DUF3320 domain-containing protein [Clostridiales bacterium]|nr:DUF3320 domain-containing protein [Clostridiales bacterium]
MNIEAFCKEGANTTLNLLTDDVRRIVEVEAPVSLDVVARRLCDACGIEKVTSKISSRVDYIVRFGRFCCSASGSGKRFIYKSASDIGMVCDTYRVGGDRDLADIPVEELAAAAIKITEVQYGMPEENLAKEVAAAFGFKRAAVTSAAFKAAMEGVKFALDNKYLVVDSNGRVILVP